MAIDAEKILKYLRGEENKRGPVSLYLDKGLYAQFKKACAEITASKVLEELMREFLRSRKRGEL